MKYRVIVEVADEDGDWPECTKSTCPYCGDKRQVVEVSVIRDELDVLDAANAAYEARHAVERMLTGKHRVDGSPLDEDDYPDLS